MPNPPRLTPAEIDAMRAREKAATPGPWPLQRPFHDQDIAMTRASVDGLREQLRQWAVDSHFVAHSRTDVPRLIAEVDALAAERSDTALHVEALESDLRQAEKAVAHVDKIASRLSEARADLARVTAERDANERLLLQIAQAIGVVYQAEGHDDVRGPDDAILEHVREAVRTANRVAEHDLVLEERDDLRTALARAEKERDEARAAAEDGRQREACREIERDHARAGRDRLLAAAVKLTCGPDDAPSTAAERAAVALDEAIAERIDPLEDTGITYLQAVFWEAWANDIHELHEIVKAAGRCECPASEDADECAEDKR